MLKDTYYTEPTEVDQLVFEKLVPPDHSLRRVKQVIDFERFRETVVECSSAAMGRTAEDPVRMIKLEFLPFHYTLSDREVIAEAQVNVAFRVFLALSLASRLPVPSLLSQFRTRLGSERHRRLFDQVVAQAREYGLVHDRLRRKEATHVVANMAVPTTLQVVAQTRQRLLESARPSRPEQVREEEAEAVRLAAVTADLKDVERLAARVVHLRAMVTWADRLQEDLGPVPEPPERVRQGFAAARELAHRVLADRDAPERGDQGRSVGDPAARRGKHGGSCDGYLLDSSVDAASALLGAVEVLAGNGDEARDAQTLLAAAEPAHGNDIAALSLDGIGWQGEVLRTLSAPEGLGVEVCVPPAPVQESPYCGPDQCTLDARGEILPCPGGQQTAAKARNAHNTGWQFTFARRTCATCALQAQCLAVVPQHQGRSVSKNDSQPEDEAARHRATTAAYTEVRRQQARVERKLADMVGNHDGRRTRYRGRWRVRIQYVLSGMVVNIKRRVKLLSPQEAQPVLQPMSAPGDTPRGRAGLSETSCLGS